MALGAARAEVVASASEAAGGEFEGGLEHWSLVPNWFPKCVVLWGEGLLGGPLFGAHRGPAPGVLLGLSGGCLGMLVCSF